MYYSNEERRRIAALCSRIGEIVFPDNLDIVEKTAFAELQKFAAPGRLSGKGRLTAGRISNSDIIRNLDRDGVLSIGEVSSEDDGYQIKSIGDDIIIAGANPRAVLHGVYDLERRILRGETEFDVKVVPYFRKRSDAIGHYHSVSVNLGNDTVDDNKAEYLARLGVNQFCACFDCSPFGLHLLDFVASDVFTFQKGPNPDAVRKLKDMSAVCAKYGIDFIMMLWEPEVPANQAPLELYPKEALGKVRRPWGGDENHIETTLCSSSPIVQEHYRNAVGKFVREFPNVKGFFFYNLDGSSWLCTPELCPRCREKLIDSDPSLHNPWEIQADLVTLLCDAAHAVRPDFTFNFWNPVHFHGEAVKKMYDRAKGYNYVTTGCDASDHDMYIPDPENICYEVQETIAAAEKYNAPAYVYFAFNRLESVQIGFPSPFTVADSLKTFKRWGIKNIMEVTGPTPALNQINAIVMSKFEMEPETDVEKFLHELAEAQFGSEAGRYMYEAWEHARSAFESWRGYEEGPLRGSHFISRISTLYGKVQEIILPDVLEKYENSYLNILTNVEPWKKEYYKCNMTWEYIERFEKMESHLAEMEEAARKAYELSSDEERIGLCFYQGSFEGLGRPTIREYAGLNLAAIEQCHSLCRQRVDMLKAVWLLRIMRDGNEQEAASAKADYLQLIRDNIVLQEEYAELLERLVKRRPCLPLTGICEDELYMYLHGTREKIAALQNYLHESEN